MKAAPALATACTTGAFCAVFAVIIALSLPMLTLWQIAIMGGISGFLGSLVARLVLGRLG